MAKPLDMQDLEDLLRSFQSTSPLLSAYQRLHRCKPFLDPPRPTPESPPIEEKAMSEEIPKQDLLLKFLNMTTSSSDGEALTAIRKANALLKTNGWTWAALLAAKIKIIEDPFRGLGVPEATRRPRGAGGMGQQQQQQQPFPQSQQPFQPSPPPPPIQQTPVDSVRANNFAGVCYHCGVNVSSHAGYLFHPANYNIAAPGGPCVICFHCNTSFIKIRANPAPPPQQTKPRGRSSGRRAPTVDEL